MGGTEGISRGYEWQNGSVDGREMHACSGGEKQIQFLRLHFFYLANIDMSQRPFPPLNGFVSVYDSLIRPC